jgi:hypothetical protein
MKNSNYRNIGIAGINIGYPTCFNNKCRTCKAKCQGEGMKWYSGGKECHNTCMSEALSPTYNDDVVPGTGIPTYPNYPDTTNTPYQGQQGGQGGQDSSNTGLYVAIGVVSIVAVGVLAYSLANKK